MFRSSKLYVTDWSFGASFSQKSLNCQRMGEPRMSTAICHLLLAGSSAWTCRTLHNAGQIQWAYGTLGLYFAKSVVGVLRYGSDFGAKFANIYDLLEICSVSLGIPLICTDLYIHHAYPPRGSTVHAAFGFLPIAGLLTKSDPNVVAAVLNTVLFGCTISLIVMGFLNSNYWAVAAGFWYMLVYDFKPNSINANLDSLNMYTLGSDTDNIIVAVLYERLELCCLFLGMPYVTTEFYIQHGYSEDVSICHAGLGCYIFFGYFLKSSPIAVATTFNVVLYGCTISLIALGFSKENYWAVAAGFFHVFVMELKPLGNHHGYRIASFYNIIESWSIAIGIPFLASDLYSFLHYIETFSFVHVFLGFILACGVVFSKYSVILSCLNLILIGNLVSLATVGFINCNYWAIAGALSYYVNLFSIKQHGMIGRVPSVDLYIIGLCFFNYFMYKILTDVSIY